MSSIINDRIIFEEFANCLSNIKQQYEERKYQQLEDPIAEALAISGTECAFLQFLNNLQVEEFDDDGSTGLRIRFHFDRNHFFTNDVLEKEYIVQANGDQLIKRTEIRWTEMSDEWAEHCTRSFLIWFMENDDPLVNIAEQVAYDPWGNPFTVAKGVAVPYDCDYGATWTLRGENKLVVYGCKPGLVNI